MLYENWLDLFKLRIRLQYAGNSPFSQILLQYVPRVYIGLRYVCAYGALLIHVYMHWATQRERYCAPHLYVRYVAKKTLRLGREASQMVRQDWQFHELFAKWTCYGNEASATAHDLTRDQAFAKYRDLFVTRSQSFLCNVP